MDSAKQALAHAQAVGISSKAMKQLEGDLVRANRALERQAGFVGGAEAGMRGMSIAVDRAASEEARLRREIEATSKALEHQVRTEQHAANRREAIGRVPGGVRHGLGTAAGLLGFGGGMAAEHLEREALHLYREFDRERRAAKAVMGITDDQQAPLIAQAIHGGGTSKFNDLKWLEAQRIFASRGLSLDQTLAVTPTAAILAQALGDDLDMAGAARLIDGSLFGFKRDLSSRASTEAAARRTADMQTKAAKISGMDHGDLEQLYKYGATPAHLAGVSEATLLAFGAMEKKSNIGGDEAGVAFRALVGAATAPTAGARTAMLANGLNFKNYQHWRGPMAVAPFVQDIAGRYGVKLSPGAQAGLGKIFANQAVVEDPARFTPAVMQYLRHELRGRDAKSLKSIAGEANRYRNASLDYNPNALMYDLMVKLRDNLPFANAMFGVRQGGRVSAGLGDPDLFKRVLEAIEHAEGAAQNISDQKMSGIDGAMSRLEGAVANIGTNLHRALDDDGKGGGLTFAIDQAAKLAQSFAELDGATLRLTAGAGAAAGALALLKGGGALLAGGGAGGALAGALGSLILTGGVAGIGAAYYFLHQKSLEQANLPDFQRRFLDPSEGRIFGTGTDASTLPLPAIKGPLPEAATPGSWYERHYGSGLLPPPAPSETTYGSGFNLANVPTSGPFSNYALSRRFPEGGYERGGALSDLNVAVRGEAELTVHVTVDASGFAHSLITSKMSLGGSDPGTTSTFAPGTTTLGDRGGW